MDSPQPDRDKRRRGEKREKEKFGENGEERREGENGERVKKGKIRNSRRDEKLDDCSETGEYEPTPREVLRDPVSFGVGC
jgi:hypothetical protein